MDYINLETNELEAISEFKPTSKVRKYHPENYEKYTPSGKSNKISASSVSRWRKYNNKTIGSKKLPRKQKILANYRHEISERDSKANTNHTLMLDSTQLVGMF